MEWLDRQWIESAMREAGYRFEPELVADWSADDRVDWFLDAVGDTALTVAERRFAERWGKKLQIDGELADRVYQSVRDTVTEWAGELDFSLYIETEPLFDGAADFVEDVLCDEALWREVDERVAQIIYDWIIDPAVATTNGR